MSKARNRQELEARIRELAHMTLGHMELLALHDRWMVGRTTEELEVAERFFAGALELLESRPTLEAFSTRIHELGLEAMFGSQVKERTTRRPPRKSARGPQD